MGSSEFSAEFQGRDQGVGQAGLLSGGSGEEFDSKLIHAVGRIQFFAAALDLRTFLTVRLGPLSAARGHPHSLSHHPLHLQSSHGISSSSSLNLSGFPFCQLPEKVFSAFKGSCDYIESTWITQGNLPVLRSTCYIT